MISSRGIIFCLESDNGFAAPEVGQYDITITVNGYVSAMMIASSSDLDINEDDASFNGDHCGIFQLERNFVKIVAGMRS